MTTPFLKRIITAAICGGLRTRYCESSADTVSWSWQNRHRLPNRQSEAQRHTLSEPGAHTLSGLPRSASHPANQLWGKRSESHALEGSTVHQKGTDSPTSDSMLRCQRHLGQWGPREAVSFRQHYTKVTSLCLTGTIKPEVKKILMPLWT